jgi:hypothetical protein
MATWGDYRWNWYTPYLFLQHLDSEGNALLQRNGIPVLTGSGSQFNMAFSDGVPDGQGGGIWLYVAGGSTSLLRLVRTNGAGHTLWDVWSPYFCWHGIGDFQRHPLFNTVWITSGENRTGGQNFRSYLYSVDIHGRFLFGRGGIPNVGGELTPTSDGMISVETDWYAPATHVVAKRIRTSGRILWQSPVALARLTGGGHHVLPVFMFTRWFRWFGCGSI